MSATLDLDVTLDEVLAGGWLELPIFPRAAREIVDLCEREDSDAKMLAEAMRKDPTLAAYVLRIANSAIFAGRSPSTTLEQALSRLGTSQIRQIMFVVVAQASAFRPRGREALGQKILQHAVTTAFFARQIAKLGRRDSEEAFLAGLLCDVGSPAILQLVSTLEVEEHTNWPVDVVERNVARLHEQVGLEIAVKWELPDRLAMVIGDHHVEHTSSAGADLLRTTVRLADLLTCEVLDETPPGDYDNLAVLLGLHPAAIDGMRALAPEVVAMAQDLV